MPFGGKFAGQPPTATALYYFVSTNTLREQGDSRPASLLGRGLYRPRDDGRTWPREFRERDFEKIRTYALPRQRLWNSNYRCQ